MYVKEEAVLVVVRWRDCMSGSIVYATQKLVKRVSHNLESTTTLPYHCISSQTMSQLAPGHFLFTSESVGEGHPGSLLLPLARSQPR